ncbi:MAG TPA: hypothetical protein VIV57_19885, partial [Anaeromyxobacter sp.]
MASIEGETGSGSERPSASRPAGRAALESRAGAAELDAPGGDLHGEAHVDRASSRAPRGAAPAGSLGGRTLLRTLGS